MSGNYISAHLFSRQIVITSNFKIKENRTHTRIDYEYSINIGAQSNPC